MANQQQPSLDTSDIKTWRSIVTLIVFVLTNIIVLFPFHIPVYIPKVIAYSIWDASSHLRIVSPRKTQPVFSRSRPASRRVSVISARSARSAKEQGWRSHFVCLHFPVNFMTAPIIADLFLLAILAIGAAEVRGGIVGVNNIAPYDIMIFFITLAYIAISVDASGLIRYLAFRVLQWGGAVGHRLFFYLYAFFFCLGSFIGNDPIILSGTAFLAYMTRVSSNITHPRAWIHTQFAVANMASAILVSSNPTNLVLAGAFKIRFVDYTVNMIVPVVITVIILFPFLLYIVFANENLIPLSIEMHQLSEEAKARKPVNPNIPHAQENLDEEEDSQAGGQHEKRLPLEEIMNPFLDKGGAIFGAALMAVTLITLLVINAVSTGKGAHPVFWVTLPAAVVMFCWDLACGWRRREETRDLARKGRQRAERARKERELREQEELEREEEEEEARQEQLDIAMGAAMAETQGLGIKLEELETSRSTEAPPALVVSQTEDHTVVVSPPSRADSPNTITESIRKAHHGETVPVAEDSEDLAPDEIPRSQAAPTDRGVLTTTILGGEEDAAARDREEQRRREVDEALKKDRETPTTLVSLCEDGYRWCQDTFPTVAAVVVHLPFALIPFAFAMFILVQALVTKGWVPVFAYGWSHWVNKTDTVGAVAGMGFLSVVLCNFAGTNIGTTILLSRVIQSWKDIHDASGIPITNRAFWATVYSMALGVNYGAFSTAFSASLAGLLWRDILARKHIKVHSLEFARVNLPIIAIAMSIGCAVLIGEVYITRDTSPYQPHE